MRGSAAVAPSRRGILAAALAATVLLPAGLAGLQRTVDVEGVVLDVETDRGIEDVILRVLGTDVSAASDREGRFVLRGVPSGRWTLRVQHLAYGTHEHDIAVDADVSVQLEVRLAQQAIELEPLVVEGESRVQRERRTTGASFWEVTREEIDRAIGTSRHLGDLIRQTVPGIKLRQASNLSQSDICLEFRAAATLSIVNARACNHPAVYLDGVQVSDPQYLYGSVGLSNIERMQMIPPGEAGARYGSGSLYGVLLIETRRPGRERIAGAPVIPTAGPPRRMTFDWDQDPAGHSTGRALAGAVLGNALGLAAGLAVARRCIDVVGEQIETSCGGSGNVAAGLAAFAFPAVGSAVGARLGGGTETSVGRLTPALIGAGMLLFPGYAFSMSTVGGDVAAVNNIGRGFLVLGVPLAVTVADRLFRKLR